MKKLTALTLTASILASAGLVPTSSFAASNELPYLNEIKKLQPDVSTEELISDIIEVAKNTGNTKEALAEQIYKELKANHEQGEREATQRNNKDTTNVQYGASGGNVKVGNSNMGDFYYTGSTTAYMNHGHVGMYYSKDLIVESVPDKGVRKIATNKRLVDKGDAVVKSVNTSWQNKNDAAWWAKDRVGKDDYSYNFANNRNTSHYGAKNCSKLIWSAYKLHGGLDLDKDGGAGVYPRDVRDAQKTSLIRNI
ncbi:YiiX/YebB-like N1pC/P60 family cysteine hydrolase [Bacillus cereus]